tara:strand:+ start:272 stop:757 length:486 start_codon:yes stop_codon:yes gene_type:complete
MITQERLKELLSYNTATGDFTWLVDRNAGSYAGDTAGTLMNKGYIHIKVDGKMYLGHRLAWLYIHGSIPTNLDHIDGNRVNNKIENLRPASSFQNAHNASIRSDNNSGYKGVGFHSMTGKWRARIRYMNKRKSLGLFDTPELAHKAYCQAADKLHGEFAHY